MNIYDQITKNKRKSWLIMLSFVGVIARLGWLFGQALQAGYLLFIIATIMAVATSGFCLSMARFLRQQEITPIKNALKLPRARLIITNCPIG